MRLFYILSISFLWFNTSSAQFDIVELRNPSFEDVPHPGGWDDFTKRRTIVKDWQDCGAFFFQKESPPDIHPNNFWKNNLPSSQGDTYLGLVVRKNGTYESVSQRLTTTLKKDACYRMSIDLAQSDSYWSAYTDIDGKRINSKDNFINPAVVRIWAGSGLCNNGDLIWESPPISNSKWNTYSFDFIPNQSYQYVTIEAFYKTPVLFEYNGHVLVDNISAIKEKECDGQADEVVVTLMPGTPEEAPKKNAIPPHLRRKKNKTPKKEQTVAKSDIADAQNNKTGKKKIMEDLVIDKIKVGQTLPINKLYFDADTSQIKPESYEVLEELTDFLYENPSVKIEIGGHTNGVPSHKYCDKLSEARAKEVAQYLMQKGIAARQVEYRGYGKRKPVASNETPVGRRRNQRVEIKILSIS